MNKRRMVKTVVVLAVIIIALFLAAVGAGYFSYGYTTRSAGEVPDMDELTQFATRYAAAWSGGDPTAFAQFYAEDGSLTINDGKPSVGRGAVEQTARGFMTNFPDMVVELVELRTEDGRVAFHWHWTGTNTGPGGTGNAVDLFGFEEWILGDDGFILESQGHMDDAEYSAVQPD